MDMNITVDTDLLTEFGKAIDVYGDDYLTKVANIYSTIDNLSNSWTGTDSSAYVEKINGYKTDIENLGKAIKNYGAFLQAAAIDLDEYRQGLTTGSTKL